MSTKANAWIFVSALSHHRNLENNQDVLLLGEYIAIDPQNGIFFSAKKRTKKRTKKDK